MNFSDTTKHFSATINFWNNPLQPTPRNVTVMCVNVCKHKFTRSNVTHKKRNGGHFTPHALSCAWVIMKKQAQFLSKNFV